MRITCKHCGGAHPAWECKRPVTKSTAETKVSPQAAIAKHGPTGVSVNAVVEREGRTTPLAGTQALPVDTNPADGFEVRPPSSSKPDRGEATDRRAGDKDDQPIPKRKVGRPKFITDLKAYKAMKQKEYRKKWKERGNDTKLG